MPEEEISLMTLCSFLPKPKSAHTQLNNKVRLCCEGWLNITQPAIPHDAGTSSEARSVFGCWNDIQKPVWISEGVNKSREQNVVLSRDCRSVESSLCSNERVDPLCCE